MADYIQTFERLIGFLPDWAASLFVFAIALFIGLLAHRLLFNLLTRLVAKRDLFWRSLVSRTARPARLAMLAIAASFASTIAPLTRNQEQALRHILLICFIILIAWIARTALHIWSTVYLRRFKLDAEDNLLARKHVTQFRFFRRITDSLLVVLAAATALMTFDEVRQYGVSLLASAGAAGIVVGFALQPVLKNLIAGVQLAITQPIRIDDALLVEGEWGRVEEITSTYVVVQLWDWRRMILPLNYFIEQPFQNWTRESASLIGTVMIYLDYRAPIEVIRAKVADIAASSPLHDGRVVNVAVTDFRERTMEVRILVSALNASRAFDLRCLVREQLIAFLRSDYPDALPRLRLDDAKAEEANASSSLQSSAPSEPLRA